MNRIWLATVITSAIFGISGSQSLADASWPGTRFISFPKTNTPEAHVTAVQPDGKILVAGYSSRNRDTGGGDLLVTRLLPDGSLDTQFGREGRISMASQDYWAFFDLEVQNDGGIIALGVGFTRLGIFRLKSNGEPDRSFGTRGIASIRVRQDSGIPWGRITLGPQGKITYVGTSYRKKREPGAYRKETVIWRLDPQGRFDRTLAGRGVVRRTGQWSKIALIGQSQANGSVTAIGASRLKGSLHPDFGRFVPTMMKLGPRGFPDPNFGRGGVKRLRGFYGATRDGFKLQACQPARAEVDSQGRFVVLATCVARSKSGQSPLVGVVVRYLPDGQLDGSFAKGGLRVVVTKPSAWFQELAFAPDGSLTITASEINTSSSIIARLDQSGGLSDAFGPRGFRVLRARRPMFYPGISVDSRGWVFAPLTLFNQATQERDELSWFSVVAIPPQG